MSNHIPESLTFYIKIEQFSVNSYYVEVDSPAGRAEGTFALPFEPDVLQMTLNSFRENIRKTRGADSADLRGLFPPEEKVLTPEEIGSQLFGAVFQKEIKALYQASRRQSRQQRTPLLFKLQIDPEADQLINVPWEYLFDPDQGVQGSFLAFQADTPVFRRWPGQERT